MAIVKVVPFPGQNGKSAYEIAVENGFVGTEQEWLDSLGGGNADIGNFTFVDNEMTTDGEMSIGVNGVPGSINLSAYSGIELSFADAEGAGLRFPDGTVQTTAYAPEQIIPLPEFLDYAVDRDQLPVLNTNFGWDAEGVWFGPTVEGGNGDSYPIFTSFTIPSDASVSVAFDAEVDAECSDIGVALYVDGEIPQWEFGTNATRIAAQFNCPNPELNGITSFGTGEGGSLPGPGIYRYLVNYNPLAEGAKVTFDVFDVNNGDTLVSSLELNERLPDGPYRIGFAADYDLEEGAGVDKSYIRNLQITFDNNGIETTYSDTLTNGNSGGRSSANIADFVFSTNGNESFMTIANHDMTIKTTRDDGQDADISLESADDIWINAYDSIEITSIQDDVRIRTADGEHIWSFASDGILQLPGQARIFTNSDDVIDNGARTYVGSTNALGQTPDESFASLNAPINTETQWFADNYMYFTGGTVTLADSTVITLTSLSQGDVQGTPAVFFLFQDFVTKTGSETYPYTIDITYSKNLGPKTTTTLEVEGPGTSNRVILDIDGAYVGEKQPQNQLVVVGDLDTGPKTWTAPNDSLYSIHQAHGGVSVELTSKAFHLYDQAYVETNYVNTNYVELVVDNYTEFLLIPIYSGSVKNRGVKLNDGGYLHNVLNFFPVSPLKWAFELETATTLYTENSYVIEMEYDGPPVLWWDAYDLDIMPEGEEWLFRGAKIEYHAYSQDAGTIIGTIYIAADSGNRHVTHIEVSNGVSDLGSIQLWNRDGNDYELYAYRTDGNSDTLNIHWTAQVYFSPDREDD